MEFNLHTIISSISIFQFLFFSFFLLIHKKGKRVSNSLLALFLFSKVLCYINSMLFIHRSSVMEWFPHGFFIGQSFEFLLGPSLYFYVKSMAYRDFSLRKMHVFHLIPFFLHGIVLMMTFHFHSAEVKRALLMNRPLIITPVEFIVIESAIYIHFIVYGIISLIVLKEYRLELKKTFSSIQYIQLTWLKGLTLGFSAIWVSSYINFLLLVTIHQTLIPGSVHIFAIFLFANIVVYKGLKQPLIFSGIEKDSMKPKYAKTPLPESEMDHYIDRLLAYMESEKPYLDSSLTINDLADKLSIPSHYISQVINTRLNQNFYNFVNGYRIEESKRVLAEQSKHKKTVLEVLYEAGFNSKSAFNNVFKKHTGMTPREFIRIQKS